MAEQNDEVDRNYGTLYADTGAYRIQRVRDQYLAGTHASTVLVLAKKVWDYRNHSQPKKITLSLDLTRNDTSDAAHAGVISGNDLECILNHDRERAQAITNQYSDQMSVSGKEEQTKTPAVSIAYVLKQKHRSLHRTQ